MTEIVAIPSVDTQLHGVVHLPKHVPGPRVGVLFSVVGNNTKFGTHRLYVQAAQAVARAGFYALRYDNRGTCDSPGVYEMTFADRVADARAALAFFRSRYQLDVLIGWGICAGAAVLAHCTTASDRSKEHLAGLVLCGVLAYPAGNPQSMARDMFYDGRLFRKLLQAPRKLKVYGENLPKLARSLLAWYLKRDGDPDLKRHRSAVDRVGHLLAQYAGPCLIVFGEKDIVWRTFSERVNPDDRLGLKRKPAPSGLVVIKEADHMFSSQEHTAELIRHTLGWLEQFRQVRLPNILPSAGSKDQGLASAPVVGQGRD